MRIIRSSVCFFLLVLTLCLSISCSAAPTKVATYEITPNGGSISDQTTDPDSARANYLILDSSISPGTNLYWDQPYKYYRVWVQNTSNRSMTVTITHNVGPVPITKDFVVPAGGQKTQTYSTTAVRHYVSFDNGEGSESGTIRVRVSDQELN